MAIEQSLDPHLIEQTKQQIRSLVSEIAQLSKEDVAPEEFYGQFLNRVVSALAAAGGAVWTVNEEGRLALQYQVNIQQTKLRENEEGLAQHGRLLYKVLSGGEGMLVPPHSGAGEAGDDQAANPTDFLLVLGPLKTDLEVAGVLEVFQRSEAGPNTQKGYLRFLLQMCELAGDFLKSHQLRHFSHRQVLWTQLEDFTHIAHTSLDPREAAYTIANEGRRLIECDRLSVAVRKGNRCHVEAISGQDIFDKRSNTVRLLGRLATAVVATGDPVWYTGDTSNMPPQVEDAVQEYVDESHSKTVAVLPLKRPEPVGEKDPDEHEQPDEPIGALIVEQIEDSRVPQSLVQRVDVVSRHSSTALANALEHQNLFLMPVWRAIGKARWIMRARTLPKTLAIAGSILGLLLILVFWPANFKLYATGTLEPVDRREVFAGIEGVVTSVNVKHGENVKEGQLLAELRNTDLDVAITEILGDLATVGQQILSVGRQLKEKGISIERRNELYGELAALKEQQKSRKAQWVLYQKKLEELHVLSPTNGQVVTWDPYKRLINRPVERGQVLMRVADPAGPWEVELLMPEDRMGYIAQARKELKEGDPLKVEYQLATDPGTEFWGTIREIDRKAEVRGEEGNTVLIKITIRKEDLPSLRPGATVNAKVYCGHRSLGFTIFHDAVAFIRSRVLFRYF